MRIIGLGLLKRIVHYYRERKFHIWYFHNHTGRFLSLDLPELTKEEKEEVKRTWPGIRIFPVDWCSVKAYKKINGFSPYYLAPCWYDDIRWYINPGRQLFALENKALVDVYFPDLSFPEVYVRCINGLFYDKDMNFITWYKAKKILQEKECYIIKPSIDSNQGKGVYKISATSCDELDILINTNALGKNFIAQEILKQAPEIEVFNPSSLNCFRVTSIYLNGKFDSVAALKMGKKGEFKDNWNSGYWVKVNDDGSLCDHGYDYNLNSVTCSDNGVVFNGCIMPKYKEMMAFLESKHKGLFPNCGIIGWDVTIDDSYNIRIIEMNLCKPGTNIEQFVSGDFFKSFRDDMLQYIKRN